MNNKIILTISRWTVFIILMWMTATPVTASNWTISIAQKDKNYRGKKHLHLWLTEVEYSHENLGLSLEYIEQAQGSYSDYKKLEATTAYGWDIGTKKSINIENEIKIDLHTNNTEFELTLDYKHQLSARYRYKIEFETDYYSSTKIGLGKSEITPSLEYGLTYPREKILFSVGLPIVTHKTIYKGYSGPKLIEYKAYYSLILAKDVFFKITYKLTNKLSGGANQERAESKRRKGILKSINI